MNSDLAKDRVISHSIINYLSASTQGKVVFYDTLAKLSAAAFKEEHLVKTQKNLNKISTWKEQLYQNECLFSIKWTTPETFEAQDAVRFLEDLRTDLKNLIQELLRILVLQDVPQDEEIKFTLAAFVRYAVSKEAFVLGLMEFGKNFSLQAMADSAIPLAEFARNEVHQAQDFVREFQKQNLSIRDPNHPVLVNLHQVSFNLPMIFRSQLHDVHQLLSTFKGGLNYSTLEFSKAEAEEWQAQGFGPVPAGYWRAYDIPPHIARIWAEAQFTDPAIAVEWIKFGFDPGTATKWLLAEFVPQYALVWAREGYEPEQAKELIQKGQQLPPPRGGGT